MKENIGATKVWAVVRVADAPLAAVLISTLIESGKKGALRFWMMGETARRKAKIWGFEVL